MVGENSLSGGERSIRIFSLPAASSSASPFPPLSGGEPLIKKRNRGLKQQVRRLKGRRNLQVNWKAISAFLYICERKKRGRFDEVSRDLLAGVRLWKVAVRGRRQQRGDGLRRGQCQTAAGIIWNSNLTLGIVLLLF